LSVAALNVVGNGNSGDLEARWIVVKVKRGDRRKSRNQHLFIEQNRWRAALEREYRDAVRGVW